MKLRFLFPMTVILGLAAALPLSAATIKGTVNAPDKSKVVIYVEKVPGNFKGQPTRMDQQEKVFIPYVLPVVQGTTVEFHNSDNLQHNVFGVGDDEFDLGNWTKGVVREHTFNKPGEVVILCNVHPEMEAYILVLQNPYFARPDENGRFSIPDVPAGEYVIRAWYKGKTKKQKVTVPASGAATVKF